MGNLGFCVSHAVHVDGTGPEWVETIEKDLYIDNLPDIFRGKKIVHVSDLHCSRTVTAKYLRRCVDRVNSLDADIVLLTGDYVTHDLRGRFREKVIELIGGIRSGDGVFACLGNHDYGMGSVLGEWNSELISDLSEGLAAAGVKVLRNNTTAIEIDGRRLWITGLGDLWVRDFNPDKAFEHLAKGEPNIVLSHNPDGAVHLRNYPAAVVLSGHTHGVQTGFVSCKPGLRIRSRRFHAGLYKVDEKQLYVNRGLGRLGRFFFNPRPEITVFTLK